MTFTNAVMRTDAWKAKVTELSTIAQAKLDASLHSGIQMAAGICLEGYIDIDADGTCRVLSSKHDQWYTVNGTCDCEAYHFAKGPERQCKHTLAKRLATKAAALCTTAAQEAPATPEPTVEPSQSTDLTTALPESKNGVALPDVLKPFIVSIKGHPFVRCAGLLALAHERGLQSLPTVFTYNDAEHPRHGQSPQAGAQRGPGRAGRVGRHRVTTHRGPQRPHGGSRWPGRLAPSSFTDSATG